MKKNTLSLDDLNTVKASELPIEREYIDPDGVRTGIFLKIIGGQSETVTKEVARLSNDRRRREAANKSKTKFGRGTNNEVAFETLESDIEFGQRLASVRLVGWRRPGETDGLTADEKERFVGIDAEPTPENTLKLCRINRDMAAFVTEQSDEVGNFTKR